MHPICLGSARSCRGDYFWKYRSCRNRVCATVFIHPDFNQTEQRNKMQQSTEIIKSSREKTRVETPQDRLNEKIIDLIELINERVGNSSEIKSAINEVRHLQQSLIRIE